MNKQTKVGQTWLLRNGDQITIDEIITGDPMPIKHGKNMCWQSNGRYWDDEFEHKLDMVKLIEKKS